MGEPTFAEVAAVVRGLRRLDGLGLFATADQARAFLEVEICLFEWIAQLPNELLNPPEVPAERDGVAGQEVLPFGGER